MTGSTGAIGAHLVPLLLEEREAEVRLLIRATDEAHLDKRLAELFAFWGYGSEQEGIRRRIRAVRGDVSLPRLGLPAGEYESLAGECTHIVHCAGNVRMNLTLEEARKSSVDAARNMMTFAGDCRRHGKFKKLEFVSTVGVGDRIGGLVPETWITKERAFHNTYEQAEVDVARHIEEGMPVTVHRPSMVVGDSRTGKIVHSLLLSVVSLWKRHSTERCSRL